jgi:hypothetical protein
LAKAKVLTEEQMDARVVKVKTIVSATVTVILIITMVLTFPSLWENAQIQQQIAASNTPSSMKPAEPSVGSGLVIGMLIAGYIWLVATVARR